MAEDDSSILIVLLETSLSLWQSPPFCTSPEGHPGQDAGNFLEQILTFVRSFLLVSESNKAAIFAVHDRSSPLLYASPGLVYSPEAAGQSQIFPATQIKERLVNLISHSDMQGEGPALAGALSRVLCYLQRIRSGQVGGSREGQRKARILAIQASPDVSAQYISFMNAIFSAQRHDVVIDACLVGGSHSSLLQQACQLTGGIYTRPARPAVLVEYLLTIYTGDTYSRSFLMQPQAHDVDFRASCFCHKRAIDLGFVCSVCLSIFCEVLQECSTCGTVFHAAEVGAKRKGSSLSSGPSWQGSQAV